MMLYETFVKYYFQGCGETVAFLHKHLESGTASLLCSQAFELRLQILYFEKYSQYKNHVLNPINLKIKQIFSSKQGRFWPPSNKSPYSDTLFNADLDINSCRSQAACAKKSRFITGK